MLFWRTKSAKTPAQENSTEPPADATDELSSTAEQVEEEVSDEKALAVSTQPETDAVDAVDVAEATPVAAANDSVNALKSVTLTPVRLSERLAEVGVPPPASSDTVVVQGPAPKQSTGAMIEPAASATAPGQAKALAALRAGLSDRTGAHVLVLGPPGTGRRSSAEMLASEIARQRPRPSDWIYAATGRGGDALKAFAVPSGTAGRLVRDVHDALAKSSAMLARLMASDSYQMTLAVLEEDHRHRNDGPLEHLKRRAEQQNIALVKTGDGFVLAPMHEGKVVRADVFRALPEALQRDVEIKVTALEAELQALLGALPGNDIATDDRHLALSQQTAERAVKPNLSVARKLFTSDAALASIFDAIEGEWTRRATDIVRSGCDNPVISAPHLQALTTAPQDGAPVIVARHLTPADFTGEIGRDASGNIAIRPGVLARAHGGFLIVDAWRLVADPSGWAALSAALEAGVVQPVSAPGLAVTAEALPLDVTLVLIAEREALAKLTAIDPRATSHFGTVVAFEETATAFDVSELVFAAWAAAVAEALGLRRLSATAAEPLYDDARSRAGDRSRVSLDIANLVLTLKAADTHAAESAREAIGREDIAAAVARRASLHQAEALA